MNTETTSGVPVPEAAAALGLTRYELARDIKAGAPVIKPGGRGRGNQTLVDIDDVAAWRRDRAAANGNAPVPVDDIGGVPLHEAAEKLGVTAEELLRDIEAGAPFIKRGTNGRGTRLDTDAVAAWRREHAAVNGNGNAGDAGAGEDTDTDTYGLDFGTEMIAVAALEVSNKVRVREQLNEPAIADYAEHYAAAGAEALPPLHVFREAGCQRWIIADGRHRHEAAQRAGLTELPCFVHEGDEVAALDHALGTNITHGVRRTDGDLAAMIRAVLETPELKNKYRTDERLADKLGVSTKTIQRHRVKWRGEAGGNAKAKDADKVRAAKSTPAKKEVDTCPPVAQSEDAATEDKPVRLVSADTEIAGQTIEEPLRKRDRTAWRAAEKALKKIPVARFPVAVHVLACSRGVSVEDLIAELRAVDESVQSHLRAMAERLAERAS
jgi:ParB-like chromosome segregation protein Spo0J/phage terminase Nu1 subunit (DNA packaging protein)